MVPKAKKRKRYSPTKVLSSWAKVVRYIPKMTEQELEAALDAEKNGEKRSDVIFRLARRLKKLRGEREMEEMLT